MKGRKLDRESGRLWMLKAFGIFLICLVGWFAMVIWTGSAFGAELTFVEELRSHLLANYGIDVSGQSMRYLSLSILGEVFSDEGLTEESLMLIDSLFEDPVPTATPNGVPEDNPATPTVLPTHTPDLTSTAEAEETENAELTPLTTETFTPTPTGTSTSTPTPTLTLTVTPTKTSKPTKTPTPTEEMIDDVYPLVICVSYLGGDEYEAIFGYENPSNKTQYIPIGERNRFDPIPKDRGQSTQFEPGIHSNYPMDAFMVTYYGSELTWHLTSSSAIASINSPDCGGILEPTPTETYQPPSDTEPPLVGAGDLNPEQGALTVCSIDIYVDYLHVEDPPYSSGINWVKLKYIIDGYTSDLYSDHLTMVDGGPTVEGGWEGYFSGSVTISINPDWDAPDDDDFYVKIWGKAMDNAGSSSYSTLGSYTMPASCGRTAE